MKPLTSPECRLAGVDPIILGGFARGGTSIVWNVLQSHPDAIGLLEETHQLFIGNNEIVSKSVERIAHVRMMLRGGGLPRPRWQRGHLFPNAGLFSPSNFSQRRIPRRLWRSVDERLARGVAATTRDPDYGLVTPGVAYGPADHDSLRPVYKNINGILMLHPSLVAMYPKATNVILLRDGLSLLESRIRRGLFRSPEKFGVVYRLLVEEAARQLDQVQGTVVLSFDDFLANPVQFATELFRAAGLRGLPSFVRLKNKPFMTSSGARSLDPDARVVWAKFSELPTLVSSEINDVQRSSLTESQRSLFLNGAGHSVELAQDLVRLRSR